jgi:hypothetical protein
LYGIRGFSFLRTFDAHKAFLTVAGLA